MILNETLFIILLMYTMMQVQENPVENMMNDVGEVVKNHFSKLITKMNEENKTVQSTIDYLKNAYCIKTKRKLKEGEKKLLIKEFTK